jgi:HEAT repeat protein
VPAFARARQPGDAPPATAPATTAPALLGANADPNAPVPSTDVPQLLAQLTDPAARPVDRDRAARRLVARAAAEATAERARAGLKAVLDDPAQFEGQVAVANALAADPNPDPRFIPTLFDRLQNGTRPALVQAAARALAAYKAQPEVLPRLIDVIRRAATDDVTEAAIAAVGTFVDKRGAEVLIQQGQRGEQKPRIAAAALDALVNMTGLTQLGRDPEAWAAWWRQKQGLTDDAFRGEMLISRAGRYDRTQTRYEALANEIYTILRAEHVSGSADQKTALLSRTLSSDQPAIRLAGIRILRDQQQLGLPIEPRNLTELRDLIGDADPDVRRATAVAVKDLNDAASLRPLLTQLQQEPEPAVRAALIAALGPIRDKSATPVLLGNLANDPNVDVAIAAATAIEGMAGRIREDAALTALTSNTLNQTLNVRTRSDAQDTLVLRAAIVRAMAALQDPNRAPTFQGLLRARPFESVPVRRAALEALGALGKGNAGVIVQHFQDNERAIRLAAVEALGKANIGFEYAEALHNLITRDPDESVRDRAWRVFQSTLPNATRGELAQWAETFKPQPARRQQILRRQADLAEEQGDDGELASIRQQIADTYMQLGQPADAIGPYRQALDHALKNKLPPGLLLNYVDPLMQATLAAGRYDDAAKLAAEMIKISPAEFTSLLGRMTTDAERLVADNRLDAARRLVGATRTVPNLPTQYTGRLNQIEADIARKQADQPSTAPAQ